MGCTTCTAASLTVSRIINQQFGGLWSCNNRISSTRSTNRTPGAIVCILILNLALKTPQTRPKIPWNEPKHPSQHRSSNVQFEERPIMYRKWIIVVFASLSTRSSYLFQFVGNLIYETHHISVARSKQFSGRVLPAFTSIPTHNLAVKTRFEPILLRVCNRKFETKTLRVSKHSNRFAHLKVLRIDVETRFAHKKCGWARQLFELGLDSGQT